MKIAKKISMPEQTNPFFSFSESPSSLAVWLTSADQVFFV